MSTKMFSRTEVWEGVTDAGNSEDRQTDDTTLPVELVRDQPVPDTQEGWQAATTQDVERPDEVLGWSGPTEAEVPAPPRWRAVMTPAALAVDTTVWAAVSPAEDRAMMSDQPTSADEPRKDQKQPVTQRPESETSKVAPVSSEPEAVASSEQAGGGKPPEQPPAKTGGGGENDDRGEGGEQPDDVNVPEAVEAPVDLSPDAETDERLAQRFGETMDAVFRAQEALTEGGSTSFRLVTSDEGPDAVIYALQPVEQEKGGPSNVWVAFSASDPDTKVPLDEVAPGSSWDRRVTPPGTSEVKSLSCPVPEVLNEFAKIAPNPPTMQKVVKTYGEWLAATEPGKVEALPAGWRNSALSRARKTTGTAEKVNGARTIVLGAMRQYDLAKERGKEIPMDTFLKPLADLFNQHLPSNSRNTMDDMMVRIIADKRLEGAIESEWDISTEAACVATGLMPAYDLAKPGLFEAAVYNDRIFKDPDFGQTFLNVMLSDKGPDIVRASTRDPQLIVEKYMLRLLRSYRGQPGRDQDRVERILKAGVPERRAERLPVPKVLQFAQAVALSEGKEAAAATSIKDFGLAGEALLYLLKLTRTEERPGDQFEQDRQHAEIIGAVAEMIPGRPQTVETTTIAEFFGRPDVSDKDKQQAVDMYLERKSLRRVYAYYRAKQKAQADVVSGQRKVWDKPGYGKHS